MAVLAIGISCMASGIVSTDPATAVLIPHTSDPDCVEYTSPQNGAIVEISATPSGLTFAYTNERPVLGEAVQAEYGTTLQFYQAGVTMPTSGSQCVLDTAPDTGPAESSCNFSVSLPDGAYEGYATLTDTQQVKEPFNLDVNPGDQPLPTLPTTTETPFSTGCYEAIDSFDGFNVSGIAVSYAGLGGLTDGYWKVSSDGGVSACGGAVEHGSMSGQALNQPTTGIASTPDGGGYWLVAKDGGIFSLGDAGFYGSMGGRPLNKPVISMAATADNRGYWLVASDGGIFSFGDAVFHGSMGGKPLNKPIVGIAATPDGGGYWLVASDGGIFAFGDAQFYGSMGGKPLNQPIVAMVPSPDGGGYFLVASDGGVFSFGDAVFSGSAGGSPPSTPVVGVAVDSNGGYWLTTSGNSATRTATETISFGGAPNYG